MNLSGLLNAPEVAVHEVFQVRVCLFTLFNEGNPIAESKAILEEERGPQALQRALAHDANPVTEHVRFVHVMGRQDDNSVFLVGFEHVPEASARAKVHSRRRFVEKDKL